MKTLRRNWLCFLVSSRLGCLFGVHSFCEIRLPGLKSLVGICEHCGAQKR